MKQKDFVILLDMDDVLINLKKHWVDALNKQYNRNINCDDIKSWNLLDYYTDITEEQLYAPLADIEVWSSMTAKEGAQEYVKKLTDKGYDIYILTAAHSYSIPFRYTLIEKMFPSIDSKHIITCYNKAMVKGDVLIDDNPLNLIGGTYKSILMDASHNRDFDNRQHNIPRFYGWSEDLYEYIVNLYETSVAVES
jgi:5'(3')-deoxyribonucleotidase